MVRAAAPQHALEPLRSARFPWLRYLLNAFVGFWVLAWLMTASGVGATFQTDSPVAGVAVLIALVAGGAVVGLLPSLVNPFEALTRVGVVLVAVFWLGVAVLGWHMASPAIAGDHIRGAVLTVLMNSQDDPLFRWGLFFYALTLFRRANTLTGNTVLFAVGLVIGAALMSLVVPAMVLVPLAVGALMPTPPEMRRYGMESPLEWLLQRQRGAGGPQRPVTATPQPEPMRWPDSQA